MSSEQLRIGVINSLLKKRVAILVNNKDLTLVESGNVEMMLSLQNMAFGIEMQGNASFRIYEKTTQMRQFFSYSKIMWSSGIISKFDMTETMDQKQLMFLVEKF